MAAHDEVTASASTVDWEQAKSALADAVSRVAILLRSVPDPDVPALGQWSVAEVAMHLSQAWIAVPGLARQDLSQLYEVVPSLAGLAGDSMIRDIWELSGTTVLAVQSDRERDLGVLADRIEARAAEYLAASAGHSASEPRAWLVEGTTVPLSALTCHLLNETLVHGYDIARGAGLPWVIDPHAATMVLSGFLVPVVRTMDSRALVDPAAAAGVRATYDVRLRGDGNFHFVFDDGQLHIEDPSSRRVDCHVSAHSPALLLLAWARTGQWPAIARGQLTAWGRKPWLGPRLRSLIRNP